MDMSSYVVQVPGKAKEAKVADKKEAAPKKKV